MEAYVLQIAVTFLGTLALLVFAWNPTGFSRANIRRIREEFSGHDLIHMPRLLRLTTWWQSLTRVGVVVFTNSLLCYGSLKRSISLESALQFLVLELVLVVAVTLLFQRSLQRDLRTSQVLLKSLRSRMAHQETMKVLKESREAHQEG